jgi:hypothetical protein
MKENKNDKTFKTIIHKCIYGIIITLIIVLVIFFITYKSGVVDLIKNKIDEIRKEEENDTTSVSYEINTTNNGEYSITIKVENANGIETIESSDNISLTCNGEQQIGLDRKIKEGEEYELNIKAVGEEQEENFVIIATDKPKITVTNREFDDDIVIETISIEYLDNPNLINYYSIDGGESWQIYNGDFDIQLLTCENDTEKTIMAKCEYTKEPKLVQNIESQYVAKMDGVIVQAGLNINESGYYEITVENETYNIHAYVYDGDTTFTTSQTFGNANDVATASRYAQNMVVVKVNGDLTINSGVTLTAYGTSYGGPKGMLIYCTGTLTNNGTITMTARGAKAVGQNVYLWGNVNGTYEYIPKVGAAGGATKTSSSMGSPSAGNQGSNGTARRTGGGASGGAGLSTSLAGAAGTSYSGGSGGGASFCNKVQSGATGLYGGAGGNAAAGTYTGWTISTGGGAGNPGGSGASGGSAGSNGTGGTLIIYADTFKNNGTISANGSAGGNGYRTGGGGSGGGSINIFYKNTYTRGTITVTGGTAGKGTRSGESANGGAGGSGCISIGNISTGSYTSN